MKEEVLWIWVWNKTKAPEGVYLSDFRLVNTVAQFPSIVYDVRIDRKGLSRSFLKLRTEIPMFRESTLPYKQIFEALDVIFADRRLTGRSSGTLRYHQIHDAVFSSRTDEVFVLDLTANPKEPWYD